MHMTNDNPSIEDLLGQKEDSGEAVAAGKKESAGERLGKKISQISRASKEQEVEARSSAAGISYVDLEDKLIDRDALALLPKKEALELRAVVLLNQEGQLRMGAVDPNDKAVEKLNQLSKEHNAQPDLYIISESSFQKAIKEYEKIPPKRKVSRVVSITAEDLEKYKDDVKDLKSLPEKLSKIPLTDVLTIILAAGIQSQASDIHVEAESDGIKLRFRLDGVLHEMAMLSLDMWKQFVSRIKLVSRLKLNINDRPQDGRISIVLPDDKLDIRVSTLPTTYGESVVMRLLRSSAAGLDFKDLGMRGKASVDLKREIARPNGMVLTTGPTGSGKTTTLYAILNALNNEETKIITLEDPVEYKLEGINQSQVERSTGYDFAKGLRSILRQDPDIVMVGEIRDLETADVAINGALTGHLVLSTLHTNDAAGAIPRFLAMGVKPFLLAPSINAVIGQRLVRKICEQCKEEVELDNNAITRVMKIVDSIPENSGFSIDKSKDLKFYQGKGCDACSGEGFKGRTGVYEVFTITPEIEKMILNGKVSEYDIKEITQKSGMISMVQDGILKALDGITSVKEVFRVTEE